MATEPQRELDARFERIAAVADVLSLTNTQRRNLMTPDGPNYNGHIAEVTLEWLEEVAGRLRQDSGIAFQREREAHFAKVLGITDGGRYRNDWDATLEVVREVVEAHRAVRAVDGSKRPYNGPAYVRAVPPRDKALDTLARLLPEDKP